MNEQPRIRVGLVGYGVIGRRVADAIQHQLDMELIGVADVAADWRIAQAVSRSIPLFAAAEEARLRMAQAGLPVSGSLEDLVGGADIVVDCTPKPRGAANAELYRQIKRPFVVQGSEAHDVAGHSFVAEVNREGLSQLQLEMGIPGPLADPKGVIP